MGRRDPVLIAWVIGLGLAAVAYAVGPQHLLFRIADSLHFALWQMGEAISHLSTIGRNAVRAMAIGLYATFVVLALGVMRRGGKSKLALLWVSILFLAFVGGSDLSAESDTRWGLALIAAGIGAVTMTRRLRQQPTKSR